MLYLKFNFKFESAAEEQSFLRKIAKGMTDGVDNLNVFMKNLAGVGAVNCNGISIGTDGDDGGEDDDD
jgi:hypothetical protein